MAPWWSRAVPRAAELCPEMSVVMSRCTFVRRCWDVGALEALERLGAQVPRFAAVPRWGSSSWHLLTDTGSEINATRAKCSGDHEPRQ